MAQALPIAAALATAGATVYASHEASKQAQKAAANQREIARQQRAHQEKLIQDQLNEQKKMQEQYEKEQGREALSLLNAEARDTARERQRTKALGAKGRSDTFLTGPLGIVEDSGYERKSLLGA
jgi:uncharacterized membrane protein